MDSNIYDVIKPVHFFSKLIGLTSFAIRKDNRQGYQAVFAVYSVLLTVISSSWNIYFISQYVLSEVVWDISREYLSELFETCSLLILISLLSYIVLTNFWFLFVKDKVMQLLNLLHEVDQMLFEFDITINHRKHQKFLIYILIFIKVCNVSGTLMSIITSTVSGAFKVSYISSFADFLGFESFSMLTLQFVLIMWAVFNRYQLANRFLMKIYSQKISEVEIISRVKVETINKISILHDKLVDVTKLLSFCYGVPVSEFYLSSHYLLIYMIIGINRLCSSWETVMHS